MGSYVRSYFMNNVRSGWWRVFYTEMVRKIAASSFHDVYDTHRPRCLSPGYTRFVRKLHFSTALNTQANMDELDLFLDLIEIVEWNCVDSWCNNDMFVGRIFAQVSGRAAETSSTTARGAVKRIFRRKKIFLKTLCVLWYPMLIRKDGYLSLYPWLGSYTCGE